MKEGYMRYVICYDIPDDRRRARLAHLLEGYGERIQFSVFTALLDQRLFDIVSSRIEQSIDPAEDKTIIFPVCRACSSKRRLFGMAQGQGDKWEEVVFIA